MRQGTFQELYSEQLDAGNLVLSMRLLMKGYGHWSSLSGHDVCNSCCGSSPSPIRLGITLQHPSWVVFLSKSVMTRGMRHSHSGLTEYCGLV